MRRRDLSWLAPDWKWLMTHRGGALQVEPLAPEQEYPLQPEAMERLRNVQESLMILP
jgi:hypothetical protein